MKSTSNPKICSVFLQTKVRLRARVFLSHFPAFFKVLTHAQEAPPPPPPAVPCPRPFQGGGWGLPNLPPNPRQLHPLPRAKSAPFPLMTTMRLWSPRPPPRHSNPNFSRAFFNFSFCVYTSTHPPPLPRCCSLLLLMGKKRKAGVIITPACYHESRRQRR